MKTLEDLITGEHFKMDNDNEELMKIDSSHLYASLGTYAINLRTGVILHLENDIKVYAYKAQDPKKAFLQEFVLRYSARKFIPQQPQVIKTMMDYGLQLWDTIEKVDFSDGK